MAPPGTPAVRLRHGVVRSLTATRPGALELVVGVDGEGEAAAIAYPSLVGPVVPGDRVLLNTTAAWLGLGTGGLHLVVAVLADREVEAEGTGRVMKLRYTPHQLRVDAVEEGTTLPETLPATPVVWIPLHSLLAPVAAGAAVAGARRVAYVMTDGSALAAGFSRLVDALRRAGLLAAVVTVGQAFGGDLEAVNVFTGMLAAVHVAGADVVVVGDGPGNLGTNSSWGVSALASAQSMNAASILGARPVAALRISFADPRPRHRGVSHHSLTALGRVALVPVHVAVPALEDHGLRAAVWDALRAERLEQRHQLVEVAGEPALAALRDRGLEVRSMGRGVDDDPVFFAAGGASGVLAARMAARDRAWRLQGHPIAPGKIANPEDEEAHMSQQPVIAPYGTWRSPITPERLARGGVRLGGVKVAGGVVHWLEGRPAEEGRTVLVRSGADGRPEDVTPPGFNLRNRVHEYGGGTYVVLADGTVFFTNWDDQRLYRQSPGAAPAPITPEPPAPMALRYADPRVTPDGRWVVCVRERHGDGEAVNELVAVPADGSGEARVLRGGHDFFSNPRVSPDGRRIAWLAWDHPNLPWDGTELWVGDLSPDGEVSAARQVAGGRSTSLFQPEWSPEGVLHVVSESSGWWNLYRLDDQGQPEPLAPREEEFGVPQWVFDLSTYDFLGDGRIVARHGPPEGHRLGILDPATGRLEDLDLGPFSTIGQTVRAEGATVALTAAGARNPWSVLAIDADAGRLDVLRQADDDPIPEGYISEAEPIEFPTEGGLSAHAFLYHPVNRDFRGPEDERPPLVVLTHGGPTSDVTAEFSPEVQFWTSRGFAVVDVNYGGSTGYGRAYRERLLGQWGVGDVADCVNAARWLAGRGDVDGGRMAIRGGSAGGYCTLCALTFYDDFAAGASYYGIGDLETFATDTHKFESRYLDSLVGPYPEAAETYRERSPANFVERLSCPMILFQGLDDRIVPPSQAEQMVEVLERKGLPYAYVPFEGEQHGFRRAENIRRCFEDELSFYGRVFGFTPAGDLPALEVRNLEP